MDQMHPKLSDHEYQQIFTNMLNGYALHEMIYDEDGQPIDYLFLDINPAFETMTGLSREMLIGKTLRQVLPDTENFWLETYAEVVRTGQAKHFENYSTMLGRYYEVYAIRTSDKKFATITLDITKQKTYQSQLKESYARYEAMIENISDIILVINADGTIRYISPNIKKHLGFDPSEAAGKMAFDIIAPDEKRRLARQYQQLLARPMETMTERVRILDAFGNSHVIELSATNMLSDHRVKGILINYHNIDKQVSFEQELLFNSRHDALTSLFNRASFNEELGRLLQTSRFPLSLVLADVSGLRLINNSFGSKHGDLVLMNAASLLHESAPDQAFIARVGGDEFGIILPGTDSNEAHSLCRAIEDLCRQKRLAASPDLQNQVPNLTLSYATQENNNDDSSTLFQDAENSLHRRKMLESSSLYSTMLASIKAAMHANSFETEEHASRMVNLSLALGRKINLDDEQLNRLSLFAALHDLGKIGIDSQILNKPGALTNAEWQIMKKHPQIGSQIALSIPELEPIAYLILTHHERWDGTGYPNKLKGDDVPLLSRLLAIIDAYDAITQDRPYRQAQSSDAALAEIEKHAGTQFDPMLVRSFIKLMS